MFLEDVTVLPHSWREASWNLWHNCRQHITIVQLNTASLKKPWSWFSASKIKICCTKSCVCENAAVMKYYYILYYYMNKNQEKRNKCDFGRYWQLCVDTTAAFCFGVSLIFFHLKGMFGQFYTSGLQSCVIFFITTKKKTKFPFLLCITPFWIFCFDDIICKCILT